MKVGITSYFIMLDVHLVQRGISVLLYGNGVSKKVIDTVTYTYFNTSV